MQASDDSRIDTGSRNIFPRRGLVARESRLSRGCTVWFTGLSGSGKSSVAAEVEARLIRSGRPAFVLDGDDLRNGLNSDLGFGMDDRSENIRRSAHVASLMAQSGVVALVSTISPLREHRALAKVIHSESRIELFEVFVDVPPQVCEARDPKGLYARARAGGVPNFTGIGSPYEPPADPALHLTYGASLSEMADRVVELVACSAHERGRAHP